MILSGQIRMVSDWAWNVFDELSSFLLTFIETRGTLKKDPTWRVRAKFNEAMHFCTMGRFHVQQDLDRAVAIHLRGIELMNEFSEQYRLGKLT